MMGRLRARRAARLAREAQAQEDALLARELEVFNDALARGVEPETAMDLAAEDAHLSRDNNWFFHLLGEDKSHE